MFCVDADADRTKTAEFAVASTPALLFFWDGGKPLILRRPDFDDDIKCECEQSPDSEAFQRSHHCFSLHACLPPILLLTPFAVLHANVFHSAPRATVVGPIGAPDVLALVRQARETGESGRPILHCV